MVSEKEHKGGNYEEPLDRQQILEACAGRNCFPGRTLMLSVGRFHRQIGMLTDCTQP